jgi:hypothetical protein
MAARVASGQLGTLSCDLALQCQLGAISLISTLAKYVLGDYNIVFLLNSTSILFVENDQPLAIQ